MKKLIPFTLAIILFCSFYKAPSLKGVWEYAGGISKGKYYSPPKNYKQQRKYSDTKFDAFLLEPGKKAVKYESGNYTLKNDSCFETQTYCLQTQKMVGLTVNYWHTVRNDTLILKGILPNGTLIEDYWKKVK
jgi:hypothetical protein